jgi:hypothetical protein
LYYALSEHYAYHVPFLTSRIEVYPGSSQHPQNAFVVEAIWDTGALFTAINRPLIEQYRIKVADTTNLIGVGGEEYQGDIVSLDIKLPSGLLLKGKRTVICKLPPSVDMILGMDIIQIGDFCVSNSGGKTLFSFIHPSLPEPLNLETEAARLNNQP